MSNVPRPTNQAAPDAVRTVTVLGSTGSIGKNTLDIVSRSPDRFQVAALTANSNAEALAEQALAFRPKLAVIGDDDKYGALKELLSGSGIEIASGEAGLVEAASLVSDLVIAGIVGTAGLRPTLAAVRRGATVGLANKECLVSAGHLFMNEVRRSGATLLPVDSEHNAIFQVFDFERPERIEKIILTASGGPFRTASLDEMSAMTPAQAVAHPNWSMGAKISVDSATMMNKGLELIEAYHLFPLEADRIEILVHPQSVIHSMVAYIDGSVLAQLGSPDMRTPIAYAMAWPDRIATPSERLDLASVASLTFEAPDVVRFPALRLAREALETGRGAPTTLNASNEVAVAAFLEGRIGFTQIASIVESVLNDTNLDEPETLDDILVCDENARRAARSFVSTISQDTK